MIGTPTKTLIIIMAVYINIVISPFSDRFNSALLLAVTLIPNTQEPSSVWNNIQTSYDPSLGLTPSIVFVATTPSLTVVATGEDKLSCQSILRFLKEKKLSETYIIPPPLFIMQISSQRKHCLE